MTESGCWDKWHSKRHNWPSSWRLELECNGGECPGECGRVLFLQHQDGKFTAEIEESTFFGGDLESGVIEMAPDDVLARLGDEDGFVIDADNWLNVSLTDGQEDLVRQWVEFWRKDWQDCKENPIE